MNEDLAKALGERVRFARHANHQTQAVVAGLSGITTDYLYQIERGKKLPAVPVITLLARALKVSVSELLGEVPPTARVPAPLEAGAAIHRALTRPIVDGGTDSVGTPWPDLCGMADLAKLTGAVHQAWC